jgi:hypothetical protein
MPMRSKAVQEALASALREGEKRRNAKVRLQVMAIALVAMLLHALWPMARDGIMLAPLMSGTIDFSNVTANFGLDQIYDTKFPASSTLLIRTGAVAGAENADSGTVLATITLPASPWAAAASGSKAKQNAWSDSSADNTGTAAHYRLTGTTTTNIEEGSVTATGGGGDMTLDNTSIAAAQVVTISTFTRTL